MKAMILAAGLGTRLRPVTENIPKALVVFEGKTLLEHAISHLTKFGVKEIVINVHHFADMIINYASKLNFGDLKIHFSDERYELLETGGGLKNASSFFSVNEPFFVRNVDVISDIDLRDIVDFHINNDALVTLAVRDRKTSRLFLFNEENNLCGWTNVDSGEIKWSIEKVENVKKLAFSGIHVVSPAIFPLITETGKFSLIDLYLRLAATHTIMGFQEKNKIWMDIGKPESLQNK